MAVPKNEKLMYSKKPKYGGYRFVRYRPEVREEISKIEKINCIIDYAMLIYTFIILSTGQKCYATFLLISHFDEFKIMARRSGVDGKWPMSAFLFRWMSPIIAFDAAKWIISVIDANMEGPFIENVVIEPFPYQTAKNLTLAVAVVVILIKKMREHCILCAIQNFREAH